MSAPAATPPSRVLDHAIRLYRASFTRCLPLALLGALLGAAAGRYPMLRLDALQNGAATAAQAFAAIAQLQDLLTSPAFWGCCLAAALIWLLFRGAIMARQHALATGRSDSLGEALGFALRRLPSMVWAALIYSVAVGVGMLLLVVPGVWLGGQLQLWMAAMFAQDSGALPSLRKSWHLIEGHWWRTSSIVTVAVLIMVIPSLLGGIGETLAVAFFRAGAAAALIASQLLSLVISVFTMPMATAVILAIYHDLERRGDHLELPISSPRTV